MEPDPTLDAPVVACVEDDLSVREALDGLLFAFGFRPQTYPSAEAFLRDAALDRVACLIVDVQLGGMSGLALQQHLAGRAPPIPTIVITAFADERTRRTALELGASAFLRKPIAQGDLLDAIAAALRQRSRDDDPDA